LAISTREFAKAAAAVDLPVRLSHTFVVLALFFPDIRPTQEHLARLLHVSRRTLNYRLTELEHMGRIRRVRGGTGRATTYRLNVRTSPWPSATTIAVQLEISTAEKPAVDALVDLP
jgi:DNA-binding Lrp family transcriptional regulator